MTFKKPTLKGNLLIIIIVVLIAVTLFCHIIAMVTRYWLRASNDSQENFLNLGLWSACFDGYVHPHENVRHRYTGCHGLYSDEYSRIRDWLIPSWLITCRALSIIALVLELIAIILFIILLLCIICRWLTCSIKNDICERVLLYATPILFILAAIFMMMTLMIFADNAFRLQCKDFWVGGTNPNNNYLAFSWGFEVAACVFGFLCSAFVIWLVVLHGREDI